MDKKIIELVGEVNHRGVKSRMQNEKRYKKGYVPGVFDLFHIGHLNLIRRAKEQSEYLMAGVLSDELVVHFKGKKPYIPFEERIAIVGAIQGVDETVKVDFSNTVKMEAWKLYHYDAYFSGNDHQDEWEREQRELQAVGSDIVYLPYTQSTSSTMIKQQIQESGKKERLYLFGAGRIGQRVLEAWRVDEKKSGQWEFAGFLDNQPQKHLTRIQGLPVYRPEDLMRLETTCGLAQKQDFSVVVTMKDAEEAMEQLRSLGVKGAYPVD